MYALPDVWIRPAFGGKGRKVTGTLEAHANGFRYTSPKGEELDIMYRWVGWGGVGGQSSLFGRSAARAGTPGCSRSRQRGWLAGWARAPPCPQCAGGPSLGSPGSAATRCPPCPGPPPPCSNIKHAFFQPADNEMIALVHFHLVNPIMVGKKKTNDVQVGGGGGLRGVSRPVPAALVAFTRRGSWTACRRTRSHFCPKLSALVQLTQPDWLRWATLPTPAQPQEQPASGSLPMRPPLPSHTHPLPCRSSTPR